MAVFRAFLQFRLFVPGSTPGRPSSNPGTPWGGLATSFFPASELDPPRGGSLSDSLSQRIFELLEPYKNSLNVEFFKKTFRHNLKLKYYFVSQICVFPWSKKGLPRIQSNFFSKAFSFTFIFTIIFPILLHEKNQENIILQSLNFILY